ncbi:MAG: GntR family transcriptional regulator [Acidimicrobiales bacterium]
MSAVGAWSPDLTSGSLAERAYYAVRQRLLTLAIPPGGLIQEDRLCAELGLGRTPVREAIKRLEAEHLVVVYPRRGTFATEMDIADHALIADVRRHLEALAAERAAEQMTRGDEAVLGSLRKDIDAIDTDDRDALMVLDGRLHQAIYRATHNAYLEATLAQYYNLALRLWYVFIERLADVHGHVEGHAALVDAILARDGARARTLAARHVEDFERAVLEVELQTIPLTPGRP